MSTPRARAELERLITDGLERYRRGDVDGALLAWEAALQVAPGDSRALGYVDYVRQNYEHLSGHPPSPMAELLVPFELGSAEDSGDYERISISRGAPSPTTWKGGRIAEPSFDDGWPIEHEKSAVGLEPAKPAPSRGTVPARTTPARSGPPLVARPSAPVIAQDDDYESMVLGPGGRSDPALVVPAVSPDDSGESTLDRQLRDPHKKATVDLSFDFGGRDVTGEATFERAAVPPSRKTAPMGAPLVPSRAATPQTLRGGTTRPPAPSRPTMRTAPPPPPIGPEPAIDPLDDLDLGLGLDLDLPGSPLELGIETVDLGSGPQPAPIPPPPVDDRAVHVEELRLPPPTTGRFQAIDNVDEAPPLPPAPPLPQANGPSMQLMADIDRDRPARETVDDAARRRITRLIDRARQAAAGGDPQLVIVAIELALAEAPDSAVAQKLIHKNRDVLLDCYYRFFGSLDKRPIVTGNLSELKTGEGRGAIDSRAAFLLSRIDGMLTYDELLDVAGMGRLEACRHLANLIGRGLVRSA